jgi:hypothetical protein
MERELCIGCGIAAKAEGHPMVAVVSHDGTFVAKPVCKACHVDPEHRTLGPIKGHFFPAGAAQIAVARAGSSSLGG